LDNWVVGEEALNGHDTERLERLIEQAWISCKEAIGVWDARFSVQCVRSLPPEVIDLGVQLMDDPRGLAEVIKIATAAAAVSCDVQWQKVGNIESNSIALSLEQFTSLTEEAPSVLGSCLGAARLVYDAQGWYRWAGKGKRLQSMPARVGSETLAAIDAWNGEGLLLVSSPVFGPDPLIEKSVDIYQARRDAEVVGGRQSGLLWGHVIANEDLSSRRMWFAGWRGPYNPALPVHVPAFDITFPSPTWYPVPAFNLAQWIEQLRPFDDALQARLGLSCDELHAGMAALGLVVERQSQCGYLRWDTKEGAEALRLESPAEGEYLHRAVGHLASILLRGTLRTSVAGFVKSLEAELGFLGWPEGHQLAVRFLDALRGMPRPYGLPTPILFYVIDPLTCVLDLSLWHAFAESCLALITSGDGDVGNHRGRLFEAQVREQLISALELDEAKLPWPANRDIWNGDSNLGDVDFCFIHDGVLVNLDMKSWQHSSDYFVGHYHAIQARLRTLRTQLERIERRGAVLQGNLENRRSAFVGRLDFLVVAFPEYLDVREGLFWYEDFPRVVTVSEIVDLAMKPMMLRDLCVRG
jgi:hypothetical protein